MHIREIITESAKAQKVVAVYGGRFQPMHIGHYRLYRKCVSQFGGTNVFIATMFGQKQQVAHAAGNYSDDPFTFDEKKWIMTRMFKIPEDRIINTSPYRPDPAKMNVDKDTTALVLVYSDKDGKRLSGIKSWTEAGLGEAKPINTGEVYQLELDAYYDDMSATDFRKAMADPEQSTKTKQRYFERYFGQFDETVFDFVVNRLQHGN